MTESTQIPPNTRSTPGEVVIVRDTERESLWFLGDLVEIIVDGSKTGGRLTVAMHHARPSSQPPLHEHDAEDEIFFILEGEITYWAQGITATLGAGDFILLPKDVPHSFQVSPDREARWLVILAPSGFEDFLREASDPAGHRGLPADFTMTPAIESRLMTAAETAGITILGPPGTRPS